VTQSDWDNTPWAGTPAAENHSLLVPSRPEIIRPTSRWEHVKAVGGPGAIAMTQGTMLDSMRGMDPQQRAKKFLQAYRVGWFFKAGRRISQDVGALEIRVAFQDSELDGDETVVKDPGLQVDLEDLEPEVQLVRLLNKPNPKQSGRAFRQEAQIRLDFAGSTFTYLEGVGEDPMALPTALYGISPARMWPARDKAGNIFGWVMDADKTGGGVPFSANEIIHTSNASEQDGDIWGVSIVEAVFAEVPLTALMARHTADVLSTGGRLAGMLWPKERTLDEGEFEDAQRAWRNVANDPNAARRLLMFPEPMEFNKGAATPAEIGIPELASLHQTQVLTAFPMSPQMLGVPAPAGLNSGDPPPRRAAGGGAGPRTGRPLRADHRQADGAVARGEGAGRRTCAHREGGRDALADQPRVRSARLHRRRGPDRHQVERSAPHRRSERTRRHGRRQPRRPDGRPPCSHG
jgi:hypothetical protein